MVKPCHAKILIAFYLCLFLVSCTNGRIKLEQVERVTVYGMSRGIEFTHGMHTVEDVMRNGRDTVISDRIVIKQLVNEINSLKPCNDSCGMDFRTAIMISLKNKKEVVVLLGERFGTQYNGNNMTDEQSLFHLIDKYIYSTQDNFYWQGDEMMSWHRQISKAHKKAEIVYNELTSKQRNDSLLFETVPSNYTDFGLMCAEIETRFYRKVHKTTNAGELLLGLLYNSKQINRDAFINKITDLSSTAYLPSSEAGISLQRVIRELLKEDPCSIVICLNKKAKEENEQFWSFVYYGVNEQEKSLKNRMILRSIRNQIDYLYIDIMNQQMP